MRLGGGGLVGTKVVNKAHSVFRQAIHALKLDP